MSDSVAAASPTVQINVEKRFMFQTQEGFYETYHPGIQWVPQEVADHWYVKLHLRGAAKPAPAPGTFEMAEQLTRERARFDEQLAALMEQNEQLQARLKAAEEQREVSDANKRIGNSARVALKTALKDAENKKD